jgi:two-component system sensor histidine kinase UhpB
MVMSITNVVSREFADAPPRGMTLDLRRLWHGFSLRSKLLIVFILTDLVAAFVAGTVTIIQARTSTRVEIAASMVLAETLAAETIRQQQSSMNALAEQLPARQRLMRHVRLSVRNAAHLPVAIGPKPDNSEAGTDRLSAPAWFEALIAPPVERRELPIVVNEQRIGSVLITGVADDEIAEAWESFVALAAVGAGLNIAVIALLFILFGRVLAPLTSLARGLGDLESRNYKVRLARPDARELGAIADRFNSLAQALETLRAENNELNRRLITAQDDERRHTALELHDEVGPCLFGLKANATSMAVLADERADAPSAERARDMLGIIDHLQTINRSLLSRLRPMALGHVPLGDLLSEVVRERAGQHPDLEVTFTPGALQTSYGEPIDLTIYRCVQESLTNAIRHARAARVDMTLGEVATEDLPRQLILQIQDDGRGIDPAAPIGHGLRGMQERVQALSGSCRVESASGGGTRVRIAIPAAAPAGAINAGAA